MAAERRVVSAEYSAVPSVDVMQVSERSQGLGQVVDALQGHHCGFTGQALVFLACLLTCLSDTCPSEICSLLFVSAMHGLCYAFSISHWHTLLPFPRVGVVHACWAVQCTTKLLVKLLLKGVVCSWCHSWH